MKIIDTTTYFEEDLMMDLRFNILDPFIDKFIVCEARFSHSGKKKEIKFDKKNFFKFEDKIIHAIIDNEPANLIIKNNLSNSEIRMNSILRIQHQRNFISNFIDQFSPEDYLIHSDNDEIPNLEAYNLKNNKKKFVIFKQKMFYYKFNLKYTSKPWFGSKACKKKYLILPQWLRDTKERKYPLWRIDILFSKMKYNSIHYVENGGWHFVNLKSPEDIEKKLNNFGHHLEYKESGLNLSDIRKMVNSGKAIYDYHADMRKSKWSGNEQLIKTDISELPIYIKENIKKYSNWIV